MKLCKQFKNKTGLKLKEGTFSASSDVHKDAQKSPVLIDLSR